LPLESPFSVMAKPSWLSRLFIPQVTTRWSGRRDSPPLRVSPVNPNITFVHVPVKHGFPTPPFTARLRTDDLVRAGTARPSNETPEPCVKSNLIARRPQFRLANSRPCVAVAVDPLRLLRKSLERDYVGGPSHASRRPYSIPSERLYVFTVGIIVFVRFVHSSSTHNVKDISLVI
jgi:hypothetical protein